jgi:hypothetical protein
MKPKQDQSFHGSLATTAAARERIPSSSLKKKKRDRGERTKKRKHSKNKEPALCFFLLSLSEKLSFPSFFLLSL